VSFMSWFQDRAAKALGKRCARSMLLAALAMKHRYASAAPSHAWLLAQAVSTAPQWRRVGEWDFIYEPSGESITILPRHSLVNVIKLMVGAEVRSATMSLNPERQIELLSMALDAVDRAIRRE
jgi:hypothetical protein